MMTRARLRAALTAAISIVGAAPHAVRAQQTVDSAFRPLPIPAAYPAGHGPVVLVDETHNNAGLMDGAFRPFADVLRRDGYRVRPLRAPLTPAGLERTDILVVIHALADTNVGHWELPTPSAFTDAEISTLTEWVRRGGAVLLATDHMPFPGAAAKLGRAFGFEFGNGFAIDTSTWDPIVFRRADGSLGRHPITEGRGPAERIDSIATFWGSAFEPLDSGATPLMIFGRGVISYHAKVAWRWNAGTPSPRVTGWWQGAARVLGKGRIVVLSESGMLSAQVSGPKRVPMGMNAPNARQNQQFVLNVMHWLSGRMAGDSE